VDAGLSEALLGLEREVDDLVPRREYQAKLIVAETKLRESDLEILKLKQRPFASAKSNMNQSPSPPGPWDSFDCPAIAPEWRWTAHSWGVSPLEGGFSSMPWSPGGALSRARKKQNFSPRPAKALKRAFSAENERVFPEKLRKGPYFYDVVFCRKGEIL
jgi:hypothetical protein